MAAKKFSSLICTLFIIFNLLFIPSNNIHGQNTELYFTILHTNDEHSALIPSPLVDYHPSIDNPSLGGFARLANAINSIREEKGKVGEPVLLLSAGDYIGGSPYSWLILDGKTPEISLMMELGYDVITIGNHEYDYGPDILAQYFKTAGYPEAQSKTAIVATNTLPPQGHPLNDIGIKDVHIKTLENGLKIGFFGLMGVEADEVAPLAKPVEFTDQIEAAKKAVKKLKDSGVDLIVAVNHTGVEEDKNLAAQVDGIDIIITGHCHTPLYQPVKVNNTLIFSTGAYLNYLGKVELAYNTTTGEVRLRDSSLIPLNHSIGEDPYILAKVAKYTHHLNNYIATLTDGRFTDITEVVLYSDFPLNNKPELKESPFGNFITDAMRIVASEVTGERVDFAFQANGVIRGALVPGSMGYSKGQITFYDLVTLVGLGSGLDGEAGYPMVSVYLTGEEVRRVLEVGALLQELMGDIYFLQMSGLRIEYNPKRSIIATIPFINLPIPSTRAVLRAEKYIGEGIQDNENFAPLNRGDKELYHVVTDYYIAQFLPVAGQVLPSLEIILKDKEGNPVEVDDTIIYRDGKELKVWQAVVEYAKNQPKDSQGKAKIPEFYNTTEPQRLIVKWTIPLIIWPIAILLILITLIILLVKKIKARKSSLNF
ncbi:bifunctional metallophosphatase/5'-nucleotidase [Anaerobranca gottschalkii]|uniref:UDP-sugar diphosphatase n=1 Tax=Anaerobranca gottschalkii DSM 13577 TaxID=1120990 RepID=A0A1I0AQS5_9FIRM|nr:bifunctional metallophosphatase/5'-nucleotidase [Anaerobranca gottschalkii]SES96533.1 UDP-sugar diphosphatase [Anaerobranca gottschalkii DSM 13577]